VDTAGVSDIKDGYDAKDLEVDRCDDPEAWLKARLRKWEPPPAGNQTDDIFTVTDEPWDPHALPPRPWLAPPYFMRGEVVLLHGPGGAGKSQLTICWAVAMALGQPFGRLQSRQRCRVLLAGFEESPRAVEPAVRRAAVLQCNAG